MPGILVIDDEKSIRNTLREILEYEKYLVDEAVDGEAGLQMIRDKKYDTILCDIKMPKMDGITLIKKMQEEKVHIQKERQVQEKERQIMKNK